MYFEFGMNEAPTPYYYYDVTINHEFGVMAPAKTGVMVTTPLPSKT